VISGAAVALVQNDTAMISVGNRVIAVGYITLTLLCGAQKRLAWLRSYAVKQSAATTDPRAIAPDCPPRMIFYS